MSSLLLLVATASVLGGPQHGRLQVHEATYEFVAKLASPNGHPNDYFGAQVAIDGDTIAVGADAYTAGPQGDGAVYLFRRAASGAWLFLKQLDTPRDSGRFGHALAMDDNRLLVGDPEWRGRQGGVFLYDRNAGGSDNWGLVGSFAGTAGDSSLGYDVTIDGNRFVGGAPSRCLGPTVCMPSPEGVGVYEKNGEVWSQANQLWSPAGGCDTFGHSVSLRGDDLFVGASTAFIVSPQGCIPPYPDGAVHLFGRNVGGGGAWGYRTSFYPPAGQGIGAEIASSSTHAAFRAYEITNWPTAYVHIYRKDGPASWSQVATLNAPPWATYASTLFFHGSRLLVGHRAQNSPPTLGRVWIHERSAGGPDGWGRVGSLEAPDGFPADGFGNSVDAAGNVLVVGAIRNFSFNPPPPPGAAYVFVRRAGAPHAPGPMSR